MQHFVTTSNLVPEKCVLVDTQWLHNSQRTAMDAQRACIIRPHLLAFPTLPRSQRRRGLRVPCCTVLALRGECGCIARPQHDAVAAPARGA
jgi:hypothetical protein